MSFAHQNSELNLSGPVPRRADENTVALWHYTVNYADALRNIDYVPYHHTNTGIDRLEGRFGSGSLYVARKSNTTYEFQNHLDAIQWGMWQSSNGASSANISSGGETCTSAQVSERFGNSYDYVGTNFSWRTVDGSGTAKRPAYANTANIDNVGWDVRYPTHQFTYKAFTNAVDGDIRLINASTGGTGWPVVGGGYYIYSVYVRAEDYVKVTAGVTGAGIFVAAYKSGGAQGTLYPLAASNPANIGSSWTHLARIEPLQMRPGVKGISMSGWERVWVVFKVDTAVTYIEPVMSFGNWGQARGLVRWTLPLLERIEDNLQDGMTIGSIPVHHVRPTAGIPLGWNSNSPQRLSYPSWPLVESVKNNQWTISFWVKLNGHNLDPQYRPVVTLDNSPSRQGLAKGAMTDAQFYDRNRFLMMFEHPNYTIPHEFKFWWSDATGNDYFGTGVAQPFNIWTHYAITRNGNTISIYMNGQLMSSKTTTVGSPADFGRANMFVGSWMGTVASLNGWVNELRFDKVCRTPEEIRAWSNMEFPFLPKGLGNFNAMVHRDIVFERPPEPVIWWPMETIDAGNVCKDYSGNGYNGLVGPTGVIEKGLALGTNGYRFDGSGLEAAVSRGLDTRLNNMFGANKDFSISYWARDNTYVYGMQFFVGNTTLVNGFPNRMVAFLTSNSGVYTISLKDGATTYSTDLDAVTYDLNHITIVRECEVNEVRVYVNGIWRTTMSVPASANFSPGTTGSILTVGDHPFEETTYTTFDEFRLYDKALTPEQIYWLTGI